VHDLVIKEGEMVWSVMIDVVSINDAGNLFDAAGLAALAALKDAKYPGITEANKADYDKKTDKKLPLKHEPIPVTVLKVGNTILVDPSPDEEDVLDARLTVCTTEKGTLSALQKGGDAPFTIEEIDHVVGLAIEKGNMLRQTLGGHAGHKNH
jgi:exosome complex component RRP42